MLRRVSTAELARVQARDVRHCLQHVQQIAVNEIRLVADHTSNNDTKVKRAIVTHKQAGMLVDAVSRTDIAKSNKLIADISKPAPGTNHSNAT